VVIDDVFPHPLSPFRTAEYEAYLARWPESVVLTSGASLGALRDRRSVADLIEAYVTDRPELRGRVMRLSDPEATRCLTDARLVSVMFLHNAFASLDLIHAYDVPFVFTLYPGGRFRLDDAASDEQLRAVCSSPNLRKVITTQKVARDYLAARRWCDPAKVEFVYGGVFPTDRLRDADAARSRYGVDKATFDVCFVAHKYMPRGSDKGYDVFIETAARLARAHQDIRFHVVGPFDASDVDIHGLEERITFHGTLTTDAFPAFYARMDVIVSPNAAFVLAPGAFDGFPTGACIEAGSCGVAVVCTDPLDQNVAFRDGEELVIVPRDAARIAERIGWLHDDADALRGLSERGQAAFLRVFDVDAQLAPRLRILSELLDSPT
jgi:glycosyltransferase involved in cell wall biosynthesis